MAWTAADFETPKKGKWDATDFSNNPEDFKNRDRAESARRSKMGTTKNMTADTITEVEQPEPKEPTILQKFGNNLMAGVGRANKATVNAIESIGGDKVPLLNKGLDYIERGADNFISKGGSSIGAQVIQSIPNAASNMALAFMSGGASIAPQLGKNATTQAAKQVLTSPTFANSMLQSYGGAYGEARGEGAKRAQAITSGLLQAFPQALIEQAGGIEKIPTTAAKNGLLKTIGKSALEEAGEEILQYPFGGLAKKATYAPETPIFSVDRPAIINPKEMGQGALVGGIAGGLFGGAGKAAESIRGRRGQVTPTIQESVAEPKIEPMLRTEPATEQARPIFYTDPYGNTSNDIDQVPKLLAAPPETEARAQKPTAEELAILNNPTNEAVTDAKYPKLDNLSVDDINTLVTELETDRKRILDEQVNWLKNSMGQGVEQGGVTRDMWGEVVDRFGRVSNNEKWYQDWAKANNYRKPTKAELYEIAEQQLFEGVQSNDAFIPPNDEYISTSEFLDYASSQLNTEQRKADIQDRLNKYDEAKHKEFYTVPLDYRREAPYTAARAGQKAESNPQTAPIGGMQRASLSEAAPTSEFAPIGGKIETPQGRIYSEEPTGNIPGDMKERGFSKNVRTDQAMPDDIRTSFDEDPLAYEQISNKDTLSKAQEIFNQGQAAAEADFYKSIGSKEFRPEDVPLSKLLAKQASEQGDTAKARQILSETATKLTEAGQFSQAAKILREADPETFLMTIDKQLKKLNKDGQKQYGKKWNDVDLTPSEIDAVNKIQKGDQQAYEGTWEQIGDRIAKELPSTGMEKFDAWRRMAMLLNPKTHIRNTVGNVIMSGMRKTSDTIGAALEKAFVPEGQRTKSVGWSLNKDIVSKVDANWNTVKKDILGESRWEIDNLKSLGREKNIFKNKALQGLNEVSLKSLNWEDNIFTARAYKDALGQYLQANNADVVTDEAVAYAKRRALEATFKQTNKLATWINEAKQAPVVGKLVEGAIPFTKTPANIMMRGFEYSPGGLMKALYDVSAKKSAATVIEDLSKGLTGTAISALGFWLASMGWAKVERKRSDKAEALMQEMGDQTNSIITPLGSYTFDWAQPLSMPLAMGIAAQEATRSMEDGDSVTQAVIDGISAGGDTLFNMSMLQNIRRILGSYGSPTEKIMGIPISYVQQAIPSILGQTARTVDPVRRSTYDPKPGKQLLNTVKAKIPGMSQSLEPMLNIWGEEQDQGGAIQQFINPGYYKPKSDDPVTNEVARLYGTTKNTDMLPKVAPNNFTANKVHYNLTAEQKTDFAQQMGQENYIDMQAIIHTSAYENMTDDERAKKLKRIADRNYEDAKKAIIKAAQ